MGLREYFQDAYERPTPADETLWHKWTLFSPRISVEGWLIMAAVWRRRVGTRWQYKKREQTDEEWSEIQW
jgi:hypothetical protein